MEKQLLIYGRVAPLSADRHSDLSVKLSGTYKFASKINSVPLLAAEFAAAAADLPIIFAGEGDNIFPAALLGFGPEENLLVDEQGHWRQGYVPAFLRRYPFVFSESADGKTLTLCIDEEFEGTNTEGLGERLFDSAGNRTQFVENTLGFVSQYQAQFNRTKQYCTRLNRLGVLKPAQARRGTADGETVALGGFSVIDRTKLKEIGDVDLREMFDTDELELSFVHMQSLGNIQRLSQLSAPVTSDETKIDKNEDEPSSTD
jgi:hypothetical protein